MKERRNRARTHYIHKISYSAQERIVGLFVIIAVGLLLWLMLSSGKTSALFEDSITIYGQLDSAQGISKDTEIKISGLDAGVIDSIDIEENNKVIVTMRIQTKFSDLLHSDSIARLTDPGIAVLGGSVINISKGSKNKPALEDKSTIIIEQAGSITKVLDEVIPTFKALQSSIENINSILNTINPESIGYTFENLHEITRDIRKATQQLQSGEGLASSLLYDRNLEANTEAIINNLVDISSTMSEIVDTLNKETANIPELVDKIGPLLNQANKTIEATQRIWPLSSAIGEETKTDVLTSPAPAND